MESGFMRALCPERNGQKMVKLFNSELKVMDVLWKEGDTTANRLVEVLREQMGWSRTTTYTVIKKCIDKGAISRHEPKYLCRALITREQAREKETTELIDKMYDGMADQLVASILWQRKLSLKEIEGLKKIIDDLS